jgi:hypothetical protein
LQVAFSAAIYGAIGEIQAEEVAAPPVADDIVWLRIKGRVEGGRQTFGHDIVLLRQGLARGSLQAAWFGTEESRQVVENLVRAQAEHMADSLR